MSQEDGMTLESLSFRTHPAGPAQPLGHGLWLTLSSGAVVSIYIDPRGQIVIEAEGQHGMMLVGLAGGVAKLVVT